MSQREIVLLTNWEVATAAGLVVLNGVVSLSLRLGLERRLLLASLRTCGQLVLAGYALQLVIRLNSLPVILSVMLLMTLIAGWAATGRVEKRYPGLLLDSVCAVFITAWVTTAIALAGVMRPRIWWDEPAQFTIPLIGLILGNTLNGISLGIDRLGTYYLSHRREVEMRLTLGATRWEAGRDGVRHAVRTGMIPVINSMMVVGLVSLPGVMTGQMLAGVPPVAAVRYQIAVMFLIAAGTAMGTTTAALLAYRRLFNTHHQFLWQKLK